MTSAKTKYIKPKPEHVAAKAQRWKAKAPAGSDPADIDAIAAAFADGEIREPYAEALVAQSGEHELPEAVAAFKYGARAAHGPSADAPRHMAAGPVTDAELDAAVEQYFLAKRDPKVAAAMKESPFAKLTARDPLAAAGNNPTVAAKFARIGKPEPTAMPESTFTAILASRREARARYGR